MSQGQGQALRSAWLVSGTPGPFPSALRSSTLNPLAAGRLSEDWTVFASGLSFQVMPANSPETGLLLLSYTFYSQLFFFRQLFSQEVLKESQTKQEVICFHMKGTKRNDGQDRKGNG